MQNGNGPSAETAPLLGSPHMDPASSNKATSHGTFAGSSSEEGTGTHDIENGLSQVGAATDEASGDSSKPKVKMAVLIPPLAIGIFLVGLDYTLTVTTYGKIGSDLEALNSTSWIATSFLLTLITFQPLYGKLSDIFGRRPCLLFAYAVFGIGCLGCGLARNIVELSIARAIAGAGGGGMNSLASILISDLVPLRERGIWQGYFSIMVTAGMSIGAPLGGFFVDNIGWRWAFILQCPIALLAFMPVYFVLRLPQADHSHWSTKILRIDFIGAFTLVSAVFLLLFGLNNGSNEGWSQKITVVPLALVPVLFTIFVFVEAKVAREPFAPGHVIFATPLLATYGANFFGFAGQMGVLFSIALFYQAALGMSATFSGLVLLPSTFFVIVGAVGGGFIMKRTGRFYWLTFTGYCLLLLGIIPIVLGVGQKSVATIVIGLSILTFGNDMTLATTVTAIVANAAPGDTAVAIACSYLFRSLGTTIGVSISTATVQQTLRMNLAQRLGDADRAGEIEEKVRQSLDYIQKLDPDVASVVRKCYAIATQWAFIPITIFAVLAIVSSLFIKEKKLDR